MHRYKYDYVTFSSSSAITMITCSKQHAASNKLDHSFHARAVQPS